ncbi:Nn.00g009310.m01.CDS01 [Neocucurbitaria sp. VM-36]
MSGSTDSSATHVDASSESGPPKIEALFLIRFDNKVGYTIAWKRTASEIDLDNAVEFKSLPSGLHAVQNDLVYFTHAGYAGLSAFAKGDAGAEERNANFVAVGILVKNEGRFGRLGRAWLLAGELEKLAAALAHDSDTVTPLDDFWNQHKPQSSSRTEALDDGHAKGHSRARAISTVSAVARDDESLPAHHPALSIPRYLDTFGPLVFRLQQAALLRKRILFVASPPVRTACEYVYNLSVLSSISTRDADVLIPGTEDLVRLPSLFSIGVHDIPYLENLRNPKHGGHTPGSEPREGWAACTTDEIISTKTQLYDIVVELPPACDTPQQPRCWPRLRTSDGSLIKASQRDVARYKLLHRELFKHRHRPQTQPEADSDADEDSDDAAPLLSRDEVDAERADDSFNEAYDDSVVEPMTWSRLAYMGFMWWASAGEQDAYMTAERDTDRELVGDVAEYSQSIETAMIAYFHRQTSLLIQTLSEVIEREREGEGHDDDDSDGGALVIDRDDLSRMGLDTWSEADRAFVQEFGSLYFGRTIVVKGSEVDCCGLRVPGL